MKIITNWNIRVIKAKKEIKEFKEVLVKVIQLKNGEKIKFNINQNS